MSVEKSAPRLGLRLAMDPGGGSLQPPHSRSHPARLKCIPGEECEPVEPLPEEEVAEEENDVRSAPCTCTSAAHAL